MAVGDAAGGTGRARCACGAALMGTTIPPASCRALWDRTHSSLLVQG
jgi:hypothetical protein